MQRALWTLCILCALLTSAPSLRAIAQDLPAPTPTPVASGAADCQYDQTTNTWTPANCENVGVPTYIQGMNAFLAKPCQSLIGSGGPLNGMTTTFQGIYDVVTFKDLSANLGLSVGNFAINLTSLLFCFSIIAMIWELRKGARQRTIYNFLEQPAVRIFAYFAVIMAITVLSGGGSGSTGGPIINGGGSLSTGGGGGTLAASLPTAGMTLADTLIDKGPVAAGIQATMSSKWGITPIPVPQDAGSIAGYGSCSAVKGFIFPLVMGGRVAEAQISAGWAQPLVDIVVSVLFMLATIIPWAAQVIGLVLLFFERVVLGVNGSIVASLGILVLAGLVWAQTRSYGMKYVDALLNLYVSGLCLGVFLWLTLNFQLLAEVQTLNQMGPGSTLSWADGGIYVCITWIFGVMVLAFALSAGKAAQQILTGVLGMSSASMLGGIASVAGLAAGGIAVAKGLIDTARGKDNTIAPAAPPDAETNGTPPPSGDTSSKTPHDPSSPSAPPPTTPDSVPAPSGAMEGGSAAAPPSTPNATRPSAAQARDDQQTPAGASADGKADANAGANGATTTSDPSATGGGSGGFGGPGSGGFTGDGSNGFGGGSEDAQQRDGESWTPDLLGDAATLTAMSRKPNVFRDRFDRMKQQFDSSSAGLAARQVSRAAGSGFAAAAGVAGATALLGKRAAHVSAPFVQHAAETLHAGLAKQDRHFGHTMGPNAPHNRDRGSMPTETKGAEQSGPPRWTSEEARGALSDVGAQIPSSHAQPFAASIATGTQAVENGDSVAAAGAFLGAAAIAEAGAAGLPEGVQSRLVVAGQRLRAAASGSGAPRLTPTLNRLANTSAPEPRIARRSEAGMSLLQQSARRAFDGTRTLQASSNALGVRAAASLDVAFDAAIARTPAEAISAMNSARSAVLAAASSDTVNGAVWQQIARELAPPTITEPVRPPDTQPEATPAG